MAPPGRAGAGLFQTQSFACCADAHEHMRRAVHRDEAETLVELDRLLVDWLDRDDRAADFFPRLHDIAKTTPQ